MSPLSISIWTALTSAVLLGVAFHRSDRSPIIGGLLGAAAGALGPQMTMLPLSYCAFKPENSYSLIVHFLGTSTTVNSAALIGLVLIAIGTSVLLLLTNQVHCQYLATGRVLGPPVRSTCFSNAWRALPWMLLTPTLVLSILTTYYPAVRTFTIATQLSRLGTDRTVPICLDNFAQLVAGPQQNAEYYIFSDGHLLHVQNVKFFSVLARSLFYAASIVLLVNIISLAIAQIACQGVKGASIYRALLVWSLTLSPAVTGTVFVLIFSQRIGLANVVLAQLGLPEVAWLQSRQLAPWAIVLTGTWNALGFSILLYITGLQNVPTDLLEAAAIDGANAWQQFRHVKIPAISPIMFFLVFTNLIYAFFDLFGPIDRLTQGGPMNSTSNLIYEVYTLGIKNRDLGRAAAVSLVMMAIVAGLTVAQFRLLGRRVHHQG